MSEPKKKESNIGTAMGLMALWTLICSVAEAVFMDRSFSFNAMNALIFVMAAGAMVGLIEIVDALRSMRLTIVINNISEVKSNGKQDQSEQIDPSV